MFKRLATGHQSVPLTFVGSHPVVCKLFDLQKPVENVVVLFLRLPCVLRRRQQLLRRRLQLQFRFRRFGRLRDLDVDLGRVPPSLFVLPEFV